MSDVEKQAAAKSEWFRDAHDCHTLDQQWGARLKQARLAAGLSQKMLGIKAGIDEFTASPRINRYELGIHKPNLLTAKRLAEVLDVPMAFFYTDTDDVLAEILLDYHKVRVGMRLMLVTLLDMNAEKIKTR